MKRIIQRIVTLALLISSGIISKSYSADMPVIPQDENMHHYSAIVGLDEEGNWQPITVKQIEGATGTFILNLGTITMSGKVKLLGQNNITIYQILPMDIAGKVSAIIVYDFASETTNLYLDAVNFVESSLNPSDFYTVTIGIGSADNILVSAASTPSNIVTLLKPLEAVNISNKLIYLAIYNKSEYSLSFKGSFICTTRNP
ncbi:MAG: hypothetical protein AB1567_05940 [bacterium]